MLTKGNAARPVGCDSPLQIVMNEWIQIFCVIIYGDGHEKGLNSPKLHRRSGFAISVRCSLKKTTLLQWDTLKVLSSEMDPAEMRLIW